MLAKIAKSLTVLAIVALLASPLLSEDKKAGQEKGKGKGESHLLNATMKKLEKAELSDEQRTKITELAKQWQSKFAEASAKAKLTKEQKQKMAEARKAATAEGKKGKDAAAAAQEAAGLSDEQKEAQAAAQKVREEFNTQVMALLSNEQKQKVSGKPKKGEKKKQAGNTKTE